MQSDAVYTMHYTQEWTNVKENPILFATFRKDVRVVARMPRFSVSRWVAGGYVSERTLFRPLRGLPRLLTGLPFALTG